MKIEHGIPLPAGRGGRELAFPWPKMQVGASIVVRGELGRLKALRSWGRWADRNGINDRKVTTRATGNGTVRVWVVSKEGSK